MLHILLIEPNRLLGEVYLNFLENAGHRVVLVKTAQSAIASLDNLSADLVILEPRLTGHNGIEFLHELRSHADWLEVPVIFLTIIVPEHLPKYQILKKIYGVDLVLYKPATKMETLLKAVSNYLNV